VEEITKGYKQALSQEERRQMLKREKTRTDLMERSPMSADDRPKVVLSPLKEGEVSKKPVSISEMIRQPTNQLLRRKSANALILDAIAQKISFVPKGMDHRSLCLCLRSISSSHITVLVCLFSPDSRRGSFVESRLETHSDPKPGGGGFVAPVCNLVKCSALSLFISFFVVGNIRPAFCSNECPSIIKSDEAVEFWEMFKNSLKAVFLFQATTITNRNTLL
jgi:hypothetical protein